MINRDDSIKIGMEWSHSPHTRQQVLQPVRIARRDRLARMMASVLNAGLAVDRDGLDSAAVGHEDHGIEPMALRQRGECGVGEVEGDPIGPRADTQGTDGLLQGLRTALQGFGEKIEPC